MMLRASVLLLKRVTTFLGFPVEFCQLVKFELLAFSVRCFYRFSPWQLWGVRKLKRTKDLRINIGCWFRPLDGWINVDGIPNPHADILADLRCRLPFESSCARYIFAEHVIEHLRREEALLFLKECYRILAPGGAIRLITPDLERFVRAYLEHDANFFAIASPDASRPVQALNVMFRQGGAHNYAYDFEELGIILREAGFRDIHHSSFRNSVWPELNLDVTDQQRQAESLYVESSK